MKKGFTLVELLVVIAILAVLMATAVVSLNPAARIKDAQNNSVKQVVRNMGIAAEACLAYVDATGISNDESKCNTSALLTGASNGGPFAKAAPTTGTINFKSDAVAHTVCVDYKLGNSDTFHYSTADAKVTTAACP